MILTNTPLLHTQLHPFHPIHIHSFFLSLSLSLLLALTLTHADSLISLSVFGLIIIFHYLQYIFFRKAHYSLGRRAEEEEGKGKRIKYIIFNSFIEHHISLHKIHFPSSHRHHLQLYKEQQHNTYMDFRFV